MKKLITFTALFALFATYLIMMLPVSNAQVYTGVNTPDTSQEPAVVAIGPGVWALVLLVLLVIGGIIGGCIIKSSCSGGGGTMGGSGNLQQCLENCASSSNPNCEDACYDD